MTDEITDFADYCQRFPHFRKCRRRGHLWVYDEIHGPNEDRWLLVGSGRDAEWVQHAVCTRCDGEKWDRNDVNHNKLDPRYKRDPDYLLHGIRVSQATMRAEEIKAQITREHATRKPPQRKRAPQRRKGAA